MRKKVYTRPLLLFLCLIIGLAGLPLQPVKASPLVPTLAVEATSTTPGDGAEYTLRYKPNVQQSDSFSVSIKIPMEYELTAYPDFIQTTVGGTVHSNIPYTYSYEGLYHYLDFLVPSSIGLDEEVIIPLSGFGIVNPDTAGAYTFVAHEPGSADQAEGTITIEAPASLPPLFESDPPQLFTGGSNYLHFNLNTAPLVEGDYIQFDFPDNFIFNFDEWNYIFNTAESSAIWLQANGDNSDTPNLVMLPGNTVQIPINNYLSGSQYQIAFEQYAVINPDAASSDSVIITTSKDNGSIEVPLTVVANPLQHVTSSKKQYAIDVEHQFTFTPHSAIDDAHPLEITWPYAYISDYLTAFDPSRVRIFFESGGVSSELPAGSIQYDYGSWSITPNGWSYGTDIPLTVRITGMTNPTEPGPYTIRLNTYEDSYSFYTGSVIEEATPSRNPGKYKHFLNISPGSYLTLPSMPGVNEFTGNSSFAVNMWIKPQTLSGIQMLYEKKAAADNELDFKLYLEEGVLTASLNKGSDPSTARVAVSPLPIAANSWNQVAASIYWDSYGELELIVNGESDYESIRELDTDLTIAGATHTPVTVGASTDGSLPFTGSIDDLQVWNDFLTASQVQHFMYWGLDFAYIDDTLKSYYPFEANSVLKDHVSGNEANYAGAPVEAFNLEPGESFEGSISLTDGLTAAAVGHADAKGQIYMADSESGTFTYTAYPYEQGIDPLIFAVLSPDMGVTLSSLEAHIGVTAELKSITVDQVTLNTHHGQFHYEWELPYDRTYVAIGAYGYPGQTRTLTVNGNTDGSDLVTNEVGMDVDLSEGMNTAEIQVLSSDASITNTYTLGIRVRSAAEEPLWSALQSITEENLLGMNTNAYDIHSNLLLPTSLTGGAALSWTSSKPDVIGPDGTVNIPSGSGEKVYLTVTAAIDGTVYQYPVPYVFYVPGSGNTPPTANSQYLYTAHEQPLSGLLTGVDLEGQNLQFSVTSEPSNGSVLLSGNNNSTFTYTPAPGFYGEDRFYFQVYDGEAYSDAVPVTIRVYGPYSGSATPDSFTINSQEIPVVAGQSQYTFSVPSVQSGLYIYANGKTGQNLSIDGSYGNYKYVELGSEDPVTVQVMTVSEDGLASNTYTFIIDRVTEPEFVLSSIVPEMFLGHGDTVSSVVQDLYLDLAWLELPEGSTYTWESSDSAVISNTGVVTRPTDGPRDVTLTLELTIDGITASKDFTLTVPQNHVPVANEQSLTFTGNTVEGYVTASDSDPGDTLTFSLEQAPPSSDGTLELDTHTGWFRFTRAHAEVTAASFTFKATDGDAVSSPATVTMTASQAELALASLEPEALLGQGDTVSNVVQDLLLDLSGLQLPTGSTYTWESSDSIVISNTGVVTRPTDGPRDVTLTLELTIDGITASKDFTLTVPQNHVPVANAQSLIFTGNTVEGYVTASDSDPGDILTFSLEQAPPSSDGTLELDTHTGWFRFTRAHAEVTAASFTFKATDGDAVSSAATVTMTASQAELALASLEPEALLGDGDTASNVVLDLLLDLSSLQLPADSTYTWESSDSAVISNTGVVTRPTDSPRNVSFTLTLTIDGVSASKSFTLTVPQNHVPVANEQSLTFTGNIVEGYVTASDSDPGDILTYSLEQAPPSSDGTLELDTHTGWFRFTRAHAGVTTTGFIFTATDGDAVSSAATVTMTASQAELALASLEPEALLGQGDTVSNVVQDLLLDLTWLELPAGSTYTWGSSDPAVISNTGVVTRPTDGPRDVTLTLTIDGITASKDFTLTVPQNHVPVANEQSLTFTGNIVEGYVTASDSDPDDTLTFSLEQAPPSSDGTLELDTHTGWFRFTRAHADVTTASFTFTVTDGDAVSSPAAVTLTEIVTVPAVLTALYVGGSPDSLSPVTLTDGEFYYDSIITGSTTIYVKPVADARALITVNNTSVSATSTAPVAIPAVDYLVNPIVITVSSPISPTIVTTYTLGVEVDSGLADVTGVTSADGTVGSVSGQQLTLTGLPAGTYNTQLTVTLADSGAVVSQARLINTETALTVHSPATIEVPLNGAPVYVVFTVQDRNGAMKLYTLTVTQGEAPPPPPPAEPVLGLAMVDWDGTGMTIGFDLPILTADLSKLRYVIGNTTYELSGAAESYRVKGNSLEIKLSSPIAAGSNPAITLQADQGAVTGVAGGKNKAAAKPLVLLNPGGTQNDDAHWDVKDLFQVMNSNPEVLTPEIIHIIINRVTPRFLTVTS